MNDSQLFETGRLRTRHYLVLLILVQLLMFAGVGAGGDFPVNDDWAYAHSVLWLLDEHRIRLSDWIAMNLLPQTLAGGLVSAMFGFSFETLRHLTQVTALATSLAAFCWFRAARFEPEHAFVGSITLVAMPCWPVLANSYMTDIYGLAFALVAATLFLRTFEQPRLRPLIVATVVAALGVLERQVVIVVPFAFMVGWLWTRRSWSWPALAIGIVPLAVAFAASVGYQFYLSQGPGIPTAQQFAHGRVLPLLMKALRDQDGMRAWVASNLISMAGYLGLFVVGWSAWWGIRGASVRGRLALATAAAAMIAGILFFGWFPPYQQNNVIDRAGIGPFTVYGAMTAPIPELDRSPGLFWRVAGIAAAFGAAAILAVLGATVAHLLQARRAAMPERVFMLVIIVGYLGPFAITGYFDRYLLFVLPFLLALWRGAWAPVVAAPLQRGIAMGWMLLVLVFATMATHDYFSWNRARWEAIRSAESLGATPATLDGGFEYNGLRRFEELPRVEVPGKSFWWVKDDAFIIAFSRVPGYEEIEAKPVQRWFARTPAEVKLLRRTETDTQGSLTK